MLDIDTPQYLNLKEGDKETLSHLVKACRILNDVFLRQDSIHNIPFRKYLEKEAQKGNNDAKMALTLFDAQLGINSKDMQAGTINLAQGHDILPGKGFYPEDLTVDEFHNILIKMLNDGEKDEVKKILNQRSMIFRKGNKLKAIDYTDYFKKEFKAAAQELKKAAKTSTSEDFKEYLNLQAKALLTDNPELDSAADKKWAKLQFTPLEFTIVRESYDDRITPTVSENKELTEMLKKEGITPYAKDSLGVRVGIVNKEGTEYLLSMKEILPILAENMPFCDEYEQVITSDNKQTMVDVDIVDMSGHIGRFRGSMVLASNLPNYDKLAVQTGGGRRNVYHIQPRISRYKDNIQQRLNAILDPEFHKYFDATAAHDFTILHENMHSLGPKKGAEKLGVYNKIIEENKADMGALAMLDLLTQKGYFTPFKQKQIITSFLVTYTLKGANFENAHRKRNIMQNNHFIKTGAVKVNEEGKMSIDFDKFNKSVKNMFDEIIRIQIDGDAQKAKTYIDSHAVWSDELELLASNLRKTDKTLNGIIVTPLADKLVSE